MVREFSLAGMTFLFCFVFDNEFTQVLLGHVCGDLFSLVYNLQYHSTATYLI